MRRSASNDIAAKSVLVAQMAARVVDAAVNLAVKVLEEVPEDHEVSMAIDVLGQDIKYRILIHCLLNS